METPPKKTPPKKASILQQISGLLFALGWMFGAGIFSFGIIFASGMAGGSPNINPALVKLLVLFVFLGAVLITFAGLAGGAAVSSSEQSDKDKNWKTFSQMIILGLGLGCVGFLCLIWA
jgi:hypothetical protein